MTGPIVVATLEQIAAVVRENLKAELAHMTGNGPKEVLLLEEVAELLHRHPKTVSRLVAEQGLPVTYISAREPRFFRTKVLAWLESRTEKPAEEP